MRLVTAKRRGNASSLLLSGKQLHLPRDMSKIKPKPPARPRVEVLHETWTKEELNAHLHAMMNRKEETPDEAPDDLRREFVEVLDQYPPHMADDDEARRYRQRMEAMLKDDDLFGGPSPDHLTRGRDHGGDRFWAAVEGGIITIIIVIIVLAIVA